MYTEKGLFIYLATCVTIIKEKEVMEWEREQRRYTDEGLEKRQEMVNYAIIFLFQKTNNYEY